jgi:hypothetical protein
MRDTLEPVGRRILTADDLNALCEYPNETLRQQLPQGGAMKPVNQERIINAARLLYARLLAGLIPPEDIDDIESELTRVIDAGLWPWYKNDLRCIKLAIRGCGFMPGHPLAPDVIAPQTNIQSLFIDPHKH